MSAFTILLIEDEKNITNFIEKILQTEGYKVLTARTGKQGLSLISSQCPDVVLLDLGLPDMDGAKIIPEAREWSSNPIIVLSARTSDQDKVGALDAGADDYIIKPFSTSELLARIRTSLRHSKRMDLDGTLAERAYSAGGLTIDFIKRRITREEEELHLTPVEFRIVEFLARNSGKVMTYSSILKDVWGPYMVEDNKILRVNMANIRRKLEKNPSEPKYILTEVGVGYRMLEDSGS